MNGQCSESGCTKRVNARGVCSMHYARAWRNGEHTKWPTVIHILSNIDPNAETADCSACGRASIAPDSEGSWCCNMSGGRHGIKIRGNERCADTHGLTRRERDTLIAREGECWICGTTDDLVVDHDHETMRIRGVLCGMCNKGLGLFFDDQIRLRRAIRFLDDPPINKTRAKLVKTV